MRDELFDRGYQEGRVALNDGIDRLIARLAGFVRLNGEAMRLVEWKAPWRTSSRNRKSGLA